ncbi:MAG: hypothetical protein LRY73_16915 [Bacillus sp. (in: Bacteria)]|nr:hypothetical protein [Bacillus sp. (in: firmicutes)]
MKWVIKAKHLNAEKEIVGLEIEDDSGTFDANIKWDGSIQINMKQKTEENAVIVNTIQTYDIDGLITKLESLKQTCRDYFDGTWNTENPYSLAEGEGEESLYGADDERVSYF